MNKNFVKSAAVKLAADADPIFDMFKNRPDEFKEYLGYKSEVRQGEELAKLRATKAMGIGSMKSKLTTGVLMGIGLVGVSLIAEKIVDFFSAQYKNYKGKEYFEKISFKFR